MNRLIDDCLILIFNNLYELQDLVNCHKVCERWKYLVEQRLVTFRYLTVYDSNDGPQVITKRRPNEILVDQKKLQYITGHPLRWKGDYVCPLKSVTRELFPNLKFVNIDRSLGFRAIDFIQHNLQDIYKRIKLRGLLELFFFNGFIESASHLDIEMYGTHLAQTIPFGSSLKQLRLVDAKLDELPSHFKLIPNLNILNLELYTSSPIPRDSGLVYQNLETLLAIDHDPSPEKILCLFELINLCPRMKNAHFYLPNNKMVFPDDRFVKNPQLESLVLIFGSKSSWSWESLKTHLYKYPNLKNLALRFYPEIYDSYLKEMVVMLPHLVTLDLRGCPSITGESEKFIGRYNKLGKRTIKIYTGPRDEVPEKPIHWMAIGSNFMESFFHHDRAPYLQDDLKD